MNFLLRGVSVYSKSGFIKNDLLVRDGLVADVSSSIAPKASDLVIELNNCFVFPGLIDVHVHLREPGFFYKETIKSGTAAAARGGFTAVCSMPNLKPVPDSLDNLKIQQNIIDRDACIHVYPYGSISVAEKQQCLSDMEALKDRVVAFTDDGVGVQSAELMEQAMIKVKALGKMVVAHCEVNGLLNGSYVHDGEFARLHGFKGNVSESEWGQVKRDIDLVRKTGCDYHVCHISTKESVELVRQAKAEGLPVSCETAPHYLILTDMDLKDEGRFRMNPPIRSEEDRQALIAGVLDGTVDMIITDHAPHSAEEKSGGLLHSLNGVVGLETSFPLMYTSFVKTGLMSLENLIGLMQENPSKRFKIGTPLEIGQPADLTVFDLNSEYEIDPSKFLSQGKASPFEGVRVFGKCKLTSLGGEIVWQDEKD